MHRWTLRAPLLGLVALVAGALTTPASAGPPGRTPGSGPSSGPSGASPSAAQAAEQARRQTGGRVLAVEERGGGYQVKVLTPSGEVRSVFVPAGR